MNKATMLILFALGLCLSGPTLGQTPAKRSISKIAGDLYRFQNNFHYSVFLVTEAGIIATDPINAEAAQWLKAELATRFAKPVKYLIYSHDHADHISGGEVFADTAIVVAHDNAKADIIAESRPTAIPQVTFSDKLTIELGGKTVELSYLGPSHSDNMVVMRFPAERVLFAVDFIPIKTLAWKDLSDSYVPEWMAAIEAVERMDFDTLAPGHGPLATKVAATEFLGYMNRLYGEVLAAARAGRTLEQMKSEIQLAEYADWGSYARDREANIEGMYNQIRLHRRGN